MRRWHRTILVTLTLLGCVAVYLPWRAQGAKEHSFALYRPGASTPYAVIKHRAAFAPIAPPIAAGGRFYFIGAEDGECAAYSSRSDPITIFSLDPSTEEFVELPSIDAPEARIDARIVALDDGFILRGGGRSEYSNGVCDTSLDWVVPFVFWVYETFPLEPIYESGDLLGLLLRLEIIKHAVYYEPVPVRESYFYRLSSHKWQRAPAFDLSEGEVAAEKGTSTSSLSVTNDYLLIASEFNERFEWLDRKSGARLPLMLPPWSFGFEFASSSTAALIYSVEELDGRWEVSQGGSKHR